MTDRRKLTRWQANKETKVKLEGAEALAKCSLRDINLKGAQIALAIKLPKDVFLKLSLVLAEDFILNLEVWVVWQKTIDGHYVYGIYFSRINDADKEKIYQFVRQYFPEQLTQQWWKGVEKGGETMEDKRIFERFSVRLPLRFLNLNNGKEGIGETRDISAKGIGLVAVEQLTSRTPLEIWVDLPNGASPLYSRGEVVWSKPPTNAQEYWAGIELEEANLMGVARVLRLTSP